MSLLEDEPARPEALWGGDVSGSGDESSSPRYLTPSGGLVCGEGVSGGVAFGPIISSNIEGIFVCLRQYFLYPQRSAPTYPPLGSQYPSGPNTPRDPQYPSGPPVLWGQILMTPLFGPGSTYRQMS